MCELPTECLCRLISGPETCFCVGSSCQLSPARPTFRGSSGDSQRQDERRSRSGRHWSHGHRPISEFRHVVYSNNETVSENFWRHHLSHSPPFFISYLPPSLLSFPPQVGFDSIGGLSGHISALKEMVVFPLLYPEVFDNFKIQPPRWHTRTHTQVIQIFTEVLSFRLHSWTKKTKWAWDRTVFHELSDPLTVGLWTRLWKINVTHLYSYILAQWYLQPVTGIRFEASVNLSDFVLRFLRLKCSI